LEVIRRAAMVILANFFSQIATREKLHVIDYTALSTDLQYF
jgi:hypothetical protein